MWHRFLERYCTVDARTLGLFRIYFGLVLLANLWDRCTGWDLITFYSNEGVLPNHWALFRPPAAGFWSPMLGFSSPGEVRVVVCVIAAVYTLYLLGWKTRWMQVLALLCYESLNLRFLLIQHGGNVVMNIVLVWTLFLPLGTRYSLDAMLKSLRGPVETGPEALMARAWEAGRQKVHVHYAYFGILLNFAFIYFFNTVHKGGPAWVSGTAVHYVLWQNRMATWLDSVIRMHEPFWLSPLLTWGTLFAEGSLVLIILSPWKQRVLRTWGWLTCWGLHGGIATLSTLGPFSFSMMGFGVLLLQGADFDFVAKKVSRPSLKRTVRLDFNDPLRRLGARVLARMDLLHQLTFEQADTLEVVAPDGKAHRGLAAWAHAAHALPLGPVYSWLFEVWFVADALRAVCVLAARWYLETGEHTPAPEEGRLHRRLRLGVEVFFCTFILLAVLSQLSMENWAVPQALKLKSRPELLTDIINYAQIPQGWSMFAPDVPRDDSRMVVDATLADGSHIDLLTERPPDFEAPLHGPYYMNQHWCEMHARMRNWPQHWRNFKDYLFRIPRLKGWPAEKQVVALEVWQVSAKVPEPGSTTFTELTKVKLFDQNI